MVTYPQDVCVKILGSHHRLQLFDSCSSIVHLQEYLELDKQSVDRSCLKGLSQFEELECPA